jgi:hypothetical protein
MDKFFECLISSRDCDSLVCHDRFITVLTDSAYSAQCGYWPWSRHGDCRDGSYFHRSDEDCAAKVKFSPEAFN